MCCAVFSPSGKSELPAPKGIGSPASRRLWLFFRGTAGQRYYEQLCCRVEKCGHAALLFLLPVFFFHVFTISLSPEAVEEALPLRQRCHSPLAAQAAFRPPARLSNCRAAAGETRCHQAAGEVFLPCILRRAALRQRARRLQLLRFSLRQHLKLAGRAALRRCFPCCTRRAPSPSMPHQA